MNELGNKVYEIIEAVVSCCATEINGKNDITIEDVVSKNRTENVVLTKQIAAMQMTHIGYTKTTIAQILGCSKANVRKLLTDGYNNLNDNMAFRFAYAEATIKCKKIIGK